MQERICGGDDVVIVDIIVLFDHPPSYCSGSGGCTYSEAMRSVV